MLKDPTSIILEELFKDNQAASDAFHDAICHPAEIMRRKNLFDICEMLIKHLDKGK